VSAQPENPFVEQWPRPSEFPFSRRALKQRTVLSNVALRHALQKQSGKNESVKSRLKAWL